MLSFGNASIFNQYLYILCNNIHKHYVYRTRLTLLVQEPK